MLALAGCNLGVPQEEEIPVTNTPPDSAAGKPTITIVSPQAGSEFFTNEQILVSASATDSVGVTRMQLLANGSIVKTVSTESASGQQSMQAVLEYTPRTPGDLELSVVAYRGAVVSDPDTITVEVEDSANIVRTVPSQGGNTGGNTDGNTGGVIPNIPNDGVCRALTNTGLNFRSAPTINNTNIITTLPAGTLAPIVGRLGNNTWWQLSYNGLIGWVSAAYTTEYGNCQFVPVINLSTPTPTPTRTPTVTPTPTATQTQQSDPPTAAGKPDLIVTNISLVEDEPVVIPGDEDSTTATVSVTVSNLGFGPAGNFESVVIIDETEYDLGIVSGLERGQSIALQVEVTFEDTGDIPIRVVVDTTDNVDELSEVNNQAQITVEVVKSI